MISVEWIIVVLLRSAAWLIILMLIFLPVEYYFPAAPKKIFRKKWLLDLGYFLLNPILVNFAMILALFTAGSIGYSFVPNEFLEAVQSQPFLLQFAEVFLLSEICGYWLHRLFHTVPYLWKYHAVHHSIEELDWLASHRQHPVELFLLLGVANLPGFILGFSLSALASFVVIQKLYTVFVHSNLDITFGPLRRVIASPRFHRWHHSYDRASHDKNYASVFPFIDILFGTYLDPMKGMPQKLGTNTPVPSNFISQIAYPVIPRMKRKRSALVQE